MTDINLTAYNAPEVARHYASIDYITPCEKLLFEKYVAPGGDILDLGVGGGRTTAFLSSRAGLYVGLDYAPAMVELCRLKFPSLKFFEGDAADLSRFADASFQTVVMAFNGIDYLDQPARLNCLRECYRVLKDNGRLIFSSHNPRAIIVAPRWNQESVREMASRATGRRPYAFPIAVAALSVAAAARSSFRAFGSSLLRILHRVFTQAFWRGEGYMLDPSHGGLVTHYGLPKRTISEAAQFKFKICELRGDDYPARSHPLTTDWYYYVFSKNDLQP